MKFPHSKPVLNALKRGWQLSLARWLTRLARLCVVAAERLSEDGETGTELSSREPSKQTGRELISVVSIWRVCEGRMAWPFANALAALFLIGSILAVLMVWP